MSYEEAMLDRLLDDEDNLQDSIIGDVSELGRATSRARTAPPSLAFNIDKATPKEKAQEADHKWNAFPTTAKKSPKQLPVAAVAAGSTTATPAIQPHVTLPPVETHFAPQVQAFEDPHRHMMGMNMNYMGMGMDMQPNMMNGMGMGMGMGMGQGLMGEEAPAWGKMWGSFEDNTPQHDSMNVNVNPPLTVNVNAAPYHPGMQYQPAHPPARIQATAPNHAAAPFQPAHPSHPAAFQKPKKPEYVKQVPTGPQVSPTNGKQKVRASAGVAAAAAQANPQPSPLLEEFRRKSRTWELPDFIGHVSEFSRDQEGSRLIQKKLEQTAEQGDVGMQHLSCIFDELRPQALNLMTDVFGNYVIQKLLENGSERHREELVHAMKGSVIDLTMQTYGCRVVQKALDLVPERLQQQIVSELYDSVPRCVTDTNGNHVIQKCIEVIPNQSAFIITAFLDNINGLATHPYGCRVIQKILEYGKRNPLSVLSQATVPVLNKIVSLARQLVVNQNGNYVIQHVMANAKPNFSRELVRNLMEDFGQISCHKFSSNVAEKIYLFADPATREHIIQILVAPTNNRETHLEEMMRDQYGNYVVQKMLDANDSCAHLLVRHIKPHTIMLQRTNYGKHILSKVEKLELSGNRGLNRA